MLEAFRGLYREVAWAYVTNGTMSFQVPEADYRAFGYEPAYEKLYVAPIWEHTYMLGVVVWAGRAKRSSTEQMA
jgi:hypothetical protein